MPFFSETFEVTYNSEHGGDFTIKKFYGRQGALFTAILSKGMTDDKKEKIISAGLETVSSVIADAFLGENRHQTNEKKNFQGK